MQNQKRLTDRYPAERDYRPMTLSYTQLSTWTRCRFKWWLRYMLQLEPKAKKAKIEIGSYVHELLRAHYMGQDIGAASDTYWKKFTKNMFDEEEELYKTMKSTAEAMIERYIEHYAAEDNFQIIACEETAYAKIPTRKGTLSKVQLQAKIDLVMEDRAGIWFIEHKVTEDLKGREEDLPVDMQFNTYYWTVVNMFREQNREVNLAGCMLNMLNPKLPSVPDLLKSTKALSKDKRIFTDEETYKRAILQNNLQISDYIDVLAELRDNPRPFFVRIKERRTPEQLQRFEDDLRETAIDLLSRKNIYRSMNFMCKRDCFFYQACIIDMKGGDATEYLQNSFNRRCNKNEPCRENGDENPQD